VDDDAGAVERFLEEHGSAYPVALDRTSQTASAFGAVGVPQTFFLDAGGTIVATLQGPAGAQQLREILDALLQREAAR
jgi:thioredoxin-like negative regulator of GroEL